MALPREVHTRILESCFDTPILLLGKVGENLATKVVFDASEWYDGSGIFQLLVKRADEEMLTATIEQNEGVISWLIPAAEIGAAGYGEIELNYIVGEARMKSARVDTRVFSSIEIDSLPPNGLTWSQLVLAAIQDARDAAEEAQGAEGEIADLIADAVAEATAQAEASAQAAAESKQASEESADVRQQAQPLPKATRRAALRPARAKIPITRSITRNRLLKAPQPQATRQLKRIRPKTQQLKRKTSQSLRATKSLIFSITRRS